RFGRRTVIAEIGDVPARPLQLKAGGGHLLGIGALAALGADGKHRIRHLLKHVLLMTAGIALVSVDRHDNSSLAKKPPILTALASPALGARGGPALCPAHSRKKRAATRVGGRAAPSSLSGEMAPSGKVFFRMAKPAGFGALAITVRPPPVTAPATSM